MVENTKGPTTQAGCRLEGGGQVMEGSGDSLPAAVLTLGCTRGSPRNPDWTPLSGTKETCRKSLPLFVAKPGGSA